MLTAATLSSKRQTWHPHHELANDEETAISANKTAILLLDDGQGCLRQVA